MTRRDLLTSVPALAAASQLPVPARAASGEKARLRSAICAYSYREELKAKKLTYDDLIRIAVDLDIDGIDMTVYWFPNTSDEFLFPLKRFAYRNGVEIYSIAVRTEFSRMTPEERQKEIADAKTWVDVAAKLGACHIRVFGGRIPKGATEDQAANAVVECLKPAADYAASKGIILGLENHGGITEKAETILKIVKAVNSPWVGVNLDTGNFVRDAYKQLEMIAPYAVNVQVKTQIKGPDGKPEPSDWDRVCRMLVAAKYRGYLALEYESKDALNVCPPMLTKLRGLVRKYSA
jgi:sugar phosphate isomerase/epimerase